MQGLIPFSTTVFLRLPRESQTQARVLKRATHLPTPLGPSFITPALIGQKKSSFLLPFSIWTAAY
jgi:hypothetical protein